MMTGSKTAAGEMTGEEIAKKSKFWAEQFARQLSLGRHIVDELAQEASIGILTAQNKYKPTRGPFVPYAQMWAFALMRKQVNRMAGPVSKDGKLPPSVSLLSPDAPEDDAGHRDDRTTRALAHEQAEFSEALAKCDARTQLMVEARIAGATNTEIAKSMGCNREYVRTRLNNFIESMA